MCKHHHSRRAVLGATAAVAGLAGCLGGAEDDPASTKRPEPIALGGSKACDICGMIIAEGYGPNGQVVFDGAYPAERDGPAWYDSVRELYVDRFTRRDRGIEPLVTYVTDYAAAGYDIETRNGDRYVTGDVEAETFTVAADAVYVVDSGIKGAMGPDMLPFGQRDAAEAFVDAEGGEVIPASEVTIDLVGSL